MNPVQDTIDNAIATNPTAIATQSPLAPGGMSVPPGGAQSGYQAPITITGTQAPTPVITGGGTATPEPTIGEQLTGIKSEALRIQDILNQRAATEGGSTADFMMPGVETGPTFEEIYGPDINDDRVQRDVLRRFQSQIDATNQVYDQLLAEAKLEGQGRLGSQRAIAARGGILGSDFAGAQKKKVQDYNTDVYRGIGAERQAAIGAILGTVSSLAQQEIANKRAARQQGAENYLSYLANAGARKQNNINSVAAAMIAQGINPQELDGAQLADIASQVGATPADLITAYSANQATTENKKYTLSEGETLVDEQGNVIAQGAVEAQRILKEGDVIVDENGNVVQTIPKTRAPGSSSGAGVYSSKNLPGDIRNELLDDIQNSVAAKDGSLTPEMLMQNYPEIDTATIQDFYDNYYSAPEEPGFFEEGGWWDNFWD